MSNKNPDCDGAHCIGRTPTRIYPLGGGANLILCENCFTWENCYRAGRGGEARGFPLIAWVTAAPFPSYTKERLP